MSDADREHERQLRQTAYHEAAHAAAAYALGIRFKRVSIVPIPGDSLGRVTLPVHWPESRRKPSAHRSVVVDLVGELVARQFRIADQGHGEYVPDSDLAAIGAGGWTAGGTEDLEKAELSARIATWSPLEAATFLKWCEARTVTISSKFEFRRRVEALVPVLLERQELSGREARRIMRRAAPGLKLRTRLRLRARLRTRRLLRPARYVGWRSRRAVRKLRACLTRVRECEGGDGNEDSQQAAL